MPGVSAPGATNAESPSRGGGCGLDRRGRRGGGRTPPRRTHSDLTAPEAGVVVALDVDALLANLVLHRLGVRVDVLLDADPLLRDGLLRGDGPLRAQRNLDLFVAEGIGVATDRLVDVLADDARGLALELDVERHRLGLDPLAQADAAGLRLLLADLELLLRARHGLAGAPHGAGRVRGVGRVVVARRRAAEAVVGVQLLLRLARDLVRVEVGGVLDLILVVGDRDPVLVAARALNRDED